MVPLLKRILCVDDEEDILQITKLALEAVGGFETDQCYSGAQGIKKARSYRPDLIMLDVMMPQMDGPSTLKLIRQDTIAANIPVIFMTARVQPSEIAEYIKLGAIGVVAKPFDPMELSKQVLALWEAFYAA